MAKPLRVLLLEDNQDDALLTLRELEKSGYETAYEIVETAEAMNDALVRQEWDIVLADYSMPRFDVFKALKLLHEQDIDIPFIVVSGAVGEDAAVAVMKAGAHDFLLKGKLTRLAAAIEREIREAEIRRDRRKIQKELKRSEFLLKEAQRIGRMGNFYLDIINNELEWSDELYKIMGMVPQKETMNYGKLLNLVHPDDKKLIQEAMDEALHNNKPFSIEHHIIRQDGRRRMVHAQGEVIYDKENKPIAMMGTVQDITERKMMEQELAESERLFRTSVESLVSSFAIYRAVRDAAGSIIDFITEYANEVSLRTVGKTREEQLGKSIFARLPRDTAQKLFALYADVVKTGKPNQRQIKFYREESGKQIFNGMWEVTATKFEDGVVVAAYDMTDHRRLEREILEISNRERQRIGQDLHDGINQQLAGISFISKVLENKLRNRGLSEAEDVEQIVRLANEVILLVRHTVNGLNPIGWSKEGLVPALRDLAFQTRKRFEISCQFKCGKFVPPMDNTVGVSLYRIAQEAINNAVKHAQSSRIFVSLSTRGGVTTLKVRDNGKGLPDDVEMSDGMGIRIMHYRAQIIGAALDTSNHPRGGAVVTCSVKNS